jgi:hypothetical protein
MTRFPLAALALCCASAPVGCGLAEKAGLVTAADVAGTHSGVLEGISITSKEDLDHREQRIVVDVDILHEVVIEETGELEAAIGSEIVPRIDAIILGAGPVAIDQYVSYPSAVAQQLSRDEAIQYVDAVLDLACQAQRL